MKKPRYYSLLSIKLPFSVAFFALLVASSIIPAARSTIQPVLRVPQDYPTIQAAIDAAPEGAVILIGHKGPYGGAYYDESITINRSLTLRGDPSGSIPYQAFLRGVEFGIAVVHIVSDASIQVTLQDLNISQGEANDVIRIDGPARVIFNKVYVSYYYGYSGLRVEDSAHVTLQDSIISGFAGFGLEVTNSVVEIMNSQISGTDENFGLVIAGSSRVSLLNSTISGHGGGILVWSPAQVTLRDSIVVGNGTGMTVSQAPGIPISQHAIVTFENSQISSNRRAGLYIEGGIVKLQGSLVMGNGIDPKCQQLPLRVACSGSGIILDTPFRDSRVQLKLQATEIRNNANWGLAAYLPQCGSSETYSFSGEVIFEGNNIIENNNRSGVLNGMGNPGDHPFKNLPDGQVCLP